jgi:hypothetical protein
MVESKGKENGRSSAVRWQTTQTRKIKKPVLGTNSAMGEFAKKIQSLAELGQ